MSIIVCLRYLNDIARHTFLPRIITFPDFDNIWSPFPSGSNYVYYYTSEIVKHNLKSQSFCQSSETILASLEIIECERRSTNAIRISRKLRYLRYWMKLSVRAWISFSDRDSSSEWSGHEARVVGAQLRLSQQAFSREKLEADWSSVLEVKPIRYGGAREMVMTMLSWGGSGVQQERIHANLSNEDFLSLSRMTEC